MKKFLRRLVKIVFIVVAAVPVIAIGAENVLKANGAEGTVIVCAGADGEEVFAKVQGNDPYYKAFVGLADLGTNLVAITLDGIESYLNGDTDIPSFVGVDLALIEAAK